MEKLEQLYEGKAKRIYKTDEPEVVWVEYKDDATAFNGGKKAQITGKGRLNNEITSALFAMLTEKGIDNHFIEKISATEQTVRKVSIVPLEVVVRNIAAGSLAKRIGFEEGTELPFPVVEFYYKDDDLGDPLITLDHIKVLDLASDEELQAIKETALNVNDILQAYFIERDIKLVDFKLEFGKTADGTLLLADEISPDTCRLWDKDTNEKLDKDVFRRNLGSLTEAYEKLLGRIMQKEQLN
ncbi:phosphoribosylaminoimidazolesuccinocarboxamide synthase [Bacillus marinisedimentorum]|uniref:phosphoribosylaminoimidazolesuccinocarboxamide synthase n=1 Tax=Bacillus marinisedimentorum TaxID=1821260 RepID=UPI000872D085|nr:phosphoribosylaminoimidazolesuccinocarboxamide synthase [Bacillus marinisedimentorum]